MQAPFADPLSGLELLHKTLPLVGREAEMQVIHVLLDTVARDLPIGARALTISGEMGVGKTRLLAEMYSEASVRGFRVLEGCAYESGSTLPYFPFIEVLRPILRSTPPGQLRRYLGLDSDEREATSGGAQMFSLVGTPLVAALARLFLDLPRLLHVTIIPEVLSPDQEKFRLLDAVATLLERMALEQPVLLGIDNLQWADSASLELTLYLTVRLHSSQVALVGVTRPPRMLSIRDREMTTASTTASAKALGDLMRHGLLLLLPLSPLNTHAAAQHLQALLPGTLSESLVQTLLTRAEGNPFFLEELVRTLTLNQQLVLRDGIWRATRVIGTALPESITLAVEQRLQGLSESCRELLRVASLFGRTFPLDALVKVLAESEEKVQSLIDEATQATVIATAPVANSIWDEYAEDGDSEIEAASAQGDRIGSVQGNHIGPAQGERISSVSAQSDRATPGRPQGSSLLYTAWPPTYMFYQGIVQEVLSAEVPIHQARSLYGAIGAALEASYASSAPAHAAELARHYVLSGETHAALYWSLLAGKDAARQQAHREAIGHFRLVLRLLEGVAARFIAPRAGGRVTPTFPSPAQLYILMGESWFKLGELEQAAKAFQQALEQLRQPHVGTQFIAPDTLAPETTASSMLQLAQANRLLADIYRMQGKYELALAHLEAARSALDRDANMHEEVNITERILFLQAQATLDLLLNRPKEAEAALWQSHQLATEIGDRGSQAFALHMLGWIRGWGEHIYEAIRLQEQAHELYVAIGDPFRAALGDQGLGIIYLTLGEIERARLHTLRGFECARRYGVQGVLGWLHWNQGAIALAQGDWANSESHLQQALQEAVANNNTRLKPMVLLLQAELYFRGGDWREAEQLFQTSIQAANNTEWHPSTMALYGHFLAVTGRRAAARTQLDRATACPEPGGYAGDFYIPFLAEGYIHLGANERATTYIERIRNLRGFMYYGNSVDRILAAVATQAGDWETAEQAFEEGLALCRRANNQPEEAAILYEQARAALTQSARETGHTHHSLERVHSLCDRARELFLQYGMQRAVDLVDTLQEGVQQLERREVAGAPEQTALRHVAQERVSLSGYHLDLSLTKRELEVLRLVADGHTDREVADTLVISPRTVNRHLSNIFVKLDVPGRAAAVAYGIRQGLV